MESAVFAPQEYQITSSGARFGTVSVAPYESVLVFFKFFPFFVFIVFDLYFFLFVSVVRRKLVGLAENIGIQVNILVPDVRQQALQARAFGQGFDIAPSPLFLPVFAEPLLNGARQLRTLIFLFGVFPGRA